MSRFVCCVPHGCDFEVLRKLQSLFNMLEWRRWEKKEHMKNTLLQSRTEVVISLWLPLPLAFSSCRKNTKHKNVQVSVKKRTNKKMSEVSEFSPVFLDLPLSLTVSLLSLLLLLPLQLHPLLFEALPLFRCFLSFVLLPQLFFSLLERYRWKGRWCERWTEKSVMTVRSLKTIQEKDNCMRWRKGKCKCARSLVCPGDQNVHPGTCLNTWVNTSELRTNQESDLPSCSREKLYSLL